MELLFKGIGALGILLVSLGVLKSEKKLGSLFYLMGGICLEIYSIHLGDDVFIVLQGLFIIIASYKVWKVWK
jgi:lipid-A-disaccharide synthase-like uncharacterized protein